MLLLLLLAVTARRLRIRRSRGRSGRGLSRGGGVAFGGAGRGSRGARGGGVCVAHRYIYCQFKLVVLSNRHQLSQPTCHVAWAAVNGLIWAFQRKSRGFTPNRAMKFRCANEIVQFSAKTRTQNGSATIRAGRLRSCLSASYSTPMMFAGCFAPPKLSSGRSPAFLPRSCSPNGDCGVMTRISFRSCNTSVPPARGPRK